MYLHSVPEEDNQIQGYNPTGATRNPKPLYCGEVLRREVILDTLNPKIPNPEHPRKAEARFCREHSTVQRQLFEAPALVQGYIRVRVQGLGRHRVQGYTESLP